MPRRESEKEDDSPPPPGFTTPTKAIRNDGSNHVEPDAEGTEDASDADVEKQSDESTGKNLKRNYTVSKNIDLSRSGSPEKMQYWRRPKSNMKFTPR